MRDGCVAEVGRQHGADPERRVDREGDEEDPQADASHARAEVTAGADGAGGRRKEGATGPAAVPRFHATASADGSVDPRFAARVPVSRAGTAGHATSIGDDARIARAVARLDRIVGGRPTREAPRREASGGRLEELVLAGEDRGDRVVGEDVLDRLGEDAAIESTSMLSGCVSGSTGTVSVTTSLSMSLVGDPLERRPVEQPVRGAGVDLASRPPPSAPRAPATSVPAVSMMSSLITATLPSTSPITVVTLASLWPGRTLLRMTRSPADHLGELARELRAAGVGRDDGERRRPRLRSRTYWANIGTAVMWSTGISKKPCT